MMTDKEIKVLYDSLTSEENAYALVKQNGYTGTMEDLMVLCSKAADDMSMNMDDMEQVAGGSTWDDIKNFTGNAVDKTLDALGKTWDWIQANPGTTAEIVGGTLAAVAGITYVVKRNRATSTENANFAGSTVRESGLSRKMPYGFHQSNGNDDSFVNISHESREPTVFEDL